MFIITKIRALLRLSEAARRADRIHRITGERYYVMPSGKKANLIIMDRANFRKFKHKGYIKNKVYVNDLERECFYCTPYRNGNGALPKEVVTMKRRQYLEYVEAQNQHKRKRPQRSCTA